MTAQLLTQKVARAAGVGWGCLLVEVHLALKGWLKRKWSVQVGFGRVHVHTQVGAARVHPNLKLGWTRARPHPSWAWRRPHPTPRWARRCPRPTLSWVWSRPRPPTCVNIIMCVINIIFSFIIQSVQIKNSIIYIINIIIFIITQSIDIKNIIMCCNHPWNS